MIIDELQIHQLRNIKLLAVNLNPRLNLITGPNGSGKTTFLEALYLLATGSSFRTRETTSLVAHGSTQLTVFARSNNDAMLSIQKTIDQPTQIKINGQFCFNTSTLAYLLPCHVFYQDIFQIIDAGPSVRRSMLDWGLFHVKPSYLTTLKQYKQVLAQRNALLRQKSKYDLVIPWDLQLVALAEQLDLDRTAFFVQWKDLFNTVLESLLSVPCSISYYKGWDKRETGKTLGEFLSQQFESDKMRQYTQSGAHQADLILNTEEGKVKSILSRGQQKLIVIALKLAQAQLLQKHCLYLFDDLAAELDLEYLRQVLSLLKGIPGQFIITSVDPSIVDLFLDFDSVSHHSCSKGEFTSKLTKSAQSFV
jgi:DNA replication and repair protein RecF